MQSDLVLVWMGNDIAVLGLESCIAPVLVLHAGVEIGTYFLQPHQFDHKTSPVQPADEGDTVSMVRNLKGSSLKDLLLIHLPERMCQPRNFLFQRTRNRISVPGRALQKDRSLCIRYKAQFSAFREKGKICLQGLFAPSVGKVILQKASLFSLQADLDPVPDGMSQLKKFLLLLSDKVIEIGQEGCPDHDHHCGCSENRDENVTVKKGSSVFAVHMIPPEAERVYLKYHYTHTGKYYKKRTAPECSPLSSALRRKSIQSAHM